MKVDKYADPPDLYALEKGLFFVTSVHLQSSRSFPAINCDFFAVP